MTTVQRGARGTIDLLDDLVVPDMMQRVAQLEAWSRPLTTVLNNLEKSYPCDNPEPQHAEDELLPNQDILVAGVTSADTNFTMGNPQFWLPNDIGMNPRTGENFRVVTATGANPVVVKRGVGGPPAAMFANDPLWIMGPAMAENSTSRDALNTLETSYTTFCQILRNSIDAGEVQMATRLFGNDFEEQAEKKLIEHKRQMDYFFKWGKPSRENVGGEWLRTMEGYNHRIQTNRMAIDGVLGEGEFDAGCEIAFQYGNEMKLGIGSPRAIRSITNFAKNRLITLRGEEAYGFTMYEYESPAGILRLAYDRELKGDIYSGYMFVIDPDYAAIRYLIAGGSGIDEKYQGSQYCRRVTYIQANDRAGRKDEIYSCLGLMMVHERVNMVFTGIKG